LIQNPSGTEYRLAPNNTYQVKSLTLGTRELAESALAHVVGDKTEQAYRSDTLARRRELMDVWAQHCEGAGGENVLAFKRPA
jgi:hypothetical protein